MTDRDNQRFNQLLSAMVSKPDPEKREAEDQTSDQASDAEIVTKLKLAKVSLQSAWAASKVPVEIGCPIAASNI